MKIKDGVNVKPGDPNYDLFKFACRVTARRFFPNFLNLDASYNRDDAWKPDDPKRYMHEVATIEYCGNIERSILKNLPKRRSPERVTYRAKFYI